MAKSSQPEGCGGAVKRLDGSDHLYSVLQALTTWWLSVQDSDLLLYTQLPEIESQGADLQLRFDVPEKTTRLLLQRIAKTDAPPALAGN
jgi:hypothetical protein